MATLADKLKQQLFGVNKPSVMSSAPIRNSRSTNFSSTDPFADTENNKYAFGTLRYPDNLGEYEYGHYILFHIFQVSQSKYAGPQKEFQPVYTDPIISKAGNKGQAGITKNFKKAEHNLYSPSIAYEDSGDINSIIRDTSDEAGGSVSKALKTSGKQIRSIFFLIYFSKFLLIYL